MHLSTSPILVIISAVGATTIIISTDPGGVNGRVMKFEFQEKGGKDERTIRL